MPFMRGHSMNRSPRQGMDTVVVHGPATKWI